MTGWSREEAHGRPVADVLRIIDGADRAPVGSALALATEEDKAANSVASCKNCILVRRDGSEVGIESTTTIIREHDESATGAIVAFRDVCAARAKWLEKLNSGSKRRVRGRHRKHHDHHP